MLRHPFTQSILGVVGQASPASATGEPAGRRTIFLQTSPVAEFQYHNGQEFAESWPGKFLRQDYPQKYDQKLSARIVELNDETSGSWEWEWERVRFEILLEKNRLSNWERYGRREAYAIDFYG